MSKEPKGVTEDIERDNIRYPKIINPPENIFLVYGEIDKDESHENLQQSEEVCWSDEMSSYSDVMYVRSDIYNNAKDLITLLRQQASDRAIDATPLECPPEPDKVSEDNPMSSELTENRLIPI